jgi:pumilio RNA-binding family
LPLPLILLQHVLERGKAHERNQIISKLAGQVVTMSQNKFASNVTEKCFQHGDITERDFLTRQIVEQTEGNDNLLVCMIAVQCFVHFSFPSLCPNRL